MDKSGEDADELTLGERRVKVSELRLMSAELSMEVASVRPRTSVDVENQFG